MFLLTASAVVCAAASLYAEPIKLTDAKFQSGDNAEWSNPAFDDSKWATLKLDKTWDAQGVKNNNSFGWYRMHLNIPKSLLNESDIKEMLLFDMGKIDDADEVYLNGRLIGKTGAFPADAGGYVSAWDALRQYAVNSGDEAINWDGDNVVAVRVYNGGEPGGMFSGGVKVYSPAMIDNVEMELKEIAPKHKVNSPAYAIFITNKNSKAIKGKLTVELTDLANGKVTSTKTSEISVRSRDQKVIPIHVGKNEPVQIRATFADKTTGRNIDVCGSPKYILTPAAPAAPRYNGPAVMGVRPGSPVIFRVAASGNRPMKFSADNLPQGLSLDPETGVLSGSLSTPGNYDVTFVMTNDKGRAEAPFTIKVGNEIALTPPMGWNSWNCWGLSVTQDKIISSAQALLDRGLADYGYNYINIDDAWEAPERNDDGTIAINDKFTDMKALGDWLHSNGLRFGIYSSPGDLTCGCYLGSLDHEQLDAETYNSWGVDYLKYDWCGYGRRFAEEGDNTLAAYVYPYVLMGHHLRMQPRDIFYSLCQYGMADVWKWGDVVGANSWRTTGDIVDTWESVTDIGFNRQAPLAPYAKPGHWNDPDMLVVGKVGWSDNLRDSRLTPDEQYSHISLWALLASNMLIGCDLAQIDDFTFNLLCNNEVNAVNQDPLGLQAERIVLDDNIQIWARQLVDGSVAMGIFNLGGDNAVVSLANYDPVVDINAISEARDLWRQQNLNTESDLRNLFIPSHGVKLLKLRL